jgi:predicted metalloprotease with PDZ domain
VTGRQVQEYISRQTGIDLTKVFQQYLTTTNVPVFEYTLVDSTLTFRWTNVVTGFDMPLKVTQSDSGFSAIRPTETWQHATVQLKDPATFRVDPNYYVFTQHDLTAPREARQ